MHSNHNSQSILDWTRAPLFGPSSQLTRVVCDRKVNVKVPLVAVQVKVCTSKDCHFQKKNTIQKSITHAHKEKERERERKRERKRERQERQKREKTRERE